MIVDSLIEIVPRKGNIRKSCANVLNERLYKVKHNIAKSKPRANNCYPSNCCSS